MKSGNVEFNPCMFTLLLKCHDIAIIGHLPHLCSEEEEDEGQGISVPKR